MFTGAVKKSAVEATETPSTTYHEPSSTFHATVSTHVPNNMKLFQGTEF